MKNIGNQEKIGDDNVNITSSYEVRPPNLETITANIISKSGEVENLSPPNFLVEANIGKAPENQNNSVVQNTRPDFEIPINSQDDVTIFSITMVISGIKSGKKQWQQCKF